MTARRVPASFSVGSIDRSAASEQFVYEPLLSVAQVSNACAAVTAVDFASASLPLLRWFRNEGMAIAARMTMIRITTRSSIRVKPLSSWVRSRSFRYMFVLLLFGGCTALTDRQAPCTVPGGDLKLGGSDALRPGVRLHTGGRRRA